MIIPIPKGCHMKITISIIVLKKERQKRIIIFRPKKYNEEQSRDNTYYEHNEKQSQYHNYGNIISHDRENHNGKTEEEDT